MAESRSEWWDRRRVSLLSLVFVVPPMMKRGKQKIRRILMASDEPVIARVKTYLDEYT